MLQVTLKCWLLKLPTGGFKKCFDFLGSLWNFPNFWPLKLQPPPHWGGGYIFYCFSWQFVTFPGLLNFWSPKIPSGWGGSIFVGLEWFPDQSAYACQIWLQSDGRVEKKGGVQTDTHTHAHARTHAHTHTQLYIVDDTTVAMTIPITFTEPGPVSPRRWVCFSLYLFLHLSPRLSIFLSSSSYRFLPSLPLATTHPCSILFHIPCHLPWQLPSPLQDQAQLAHVVECLRCSTQELDAEAFHHLILTARSIAVVRPANLVRFAEQESSHILQRCTQTGVWLVFISFIIQKHYILFFLIVFQYCFSLRDNSCVM